MSDDFESRLESAISRSTPPMKASQQRGELAQRTETPTLRIVFHCQSGSKAQFIVWPITFLDFRTNHCSVKWAEDRLVFAMIFELFSDAYNQYSRLEMVIDRIQI